MKIGDYVKAVDPEFFGIITEIIPSFDGNLYGVTDGKRTCFFSETDLESAGFLDAVHAAIREDPEPIYTVLLMIGIVCIAAGMIEIALIITLIMLMIAIRR